MISFPDPSVAVQVTVLHLEAVYDATLRELGMDLDGPHLSFWLFGQSFLLVQYSGGILETMLETELPSKSM